MPKMRAVRGRVCMFMEKLMAFWCWGGGRYLFASKQTWIIYNLLLSYSFIFHKITSIQFECNSTFIVSSNSRFKKRDFSLTGVPCSLLCPHPKQLWHWGKSPDPHTCGLRTIYNDKNPGQRRAWVSMGVSLQLRLQIWGRSSRCRQHPSPPALILGKGNTLFFGEH